LNMGWAGSDDAWYDLPNIGTWANFNKVYKCVYNVFETGTDEIISGRILDELGMPISNVVVSADGITNNTDNRGIYALVHVTPGSRTVTASKTGFIFMSTNVIVGTSIDYSTVGNVWEIDFVGIIPEPGTIWIMTVLGALLCKHNTLLR
ncbi:carboxypeptidase regulatory-like domain-containing protein, partial [bacterium]|nr:carboxypeptidase regulatory-like domain-containing protein [bacterium]